MKVLEFRPFSRDSMKQIALQHYRMKTPQASESALQQMEEEINQALNRQFENHGNLSLRSLPQARRDEQFSTPCRQTRQGRYHRSLDRVTTRFKLRSVYIFTCHLSIRSNVPEGVNLQQIILLATTLVLHAAGL